MVVFKEEGVFQEGALILVDKPLKWTSFDVVNKIRWCLRKKWGMPVRWILWRPVW